MENLLFIYNILMTIVITLVIAGLSILIIGKKNNQAKVIFTLMCILLVDNSVTYISEYSDSISKLYETTEGIYILIYLLLIAIIINGRLLIKSFLDMKIRNVEWLVIILVTIINIFTSLMLEYELAELIVYISFYSGILCLALLGYYGLRKLDCRRKLFNVGLIAVVIICLIGIADSYVYYSTFEELNSNTIDFLEFRNYGLEGIKILLLISTTTYLIKHLKSLTTDNVTFDDKIDLFVVKYELTPRQKEILVLMINGDSNKEISGKLFITEGTVKTHVYNIFQKTEVTSRNQLMKMVMYEES